MHDAIVMGAGPAGCAAAKLLADAGLDVLLVERATLPRNKSCSGSLIQRTLRAVSQTFGAEVPLEATCTPVETAGLILVDDAEVEHVTDQEGLNVWRAPFDAWLAYKAANAGARLLQGTGARVGTSTTDFVEVRLRHGGSISTEMARFVIDCRGAAALNRPDGRERSGRPVVTYQTFHRGTCDLDERYFYGFLQEGLSDYDAWFNVKDGLLVIGSAAASSLEARRYHERFLDYLSERHELRVGEALRHETWAMPRVEPGCPLHLGTGRVFACGEAAGLLNPMGEGISSALESGVAAARAIATHPNDPGAALEAYRKATRILRGYMMRQWDYVGRMSPRFAHLTL